MREGTFRKHISEPICSGISNFEASRCGHEGGYTRVEQAGRSGGRGVSLDARDRLWGHIGIPLG